jgi:hypothetical protein
VLPDFKCAYLQALIFFIFLGSGLLSLCSNQGLEVNLHLGWVPLQIASIPGVDIVSGMSISHL